jgi:hypothetical protein
MSENGTQANTIWYVGANNALLSYAKGQYLGDMSSDWSFETIGSAGNTTTFVQGATIGKIQIKPSEGRSLYGDKIRVDAAGEASNSGNYEWTIEEVTDLPVTITEAGASTLYAPVALSLPTLSEGQELKVYTAVKNGEYLILEEVESVIPANTGVILMGKEGTTVTYNFTISDGPSERVGELTGTVATKANPNDGTIYTLQKPDPEGAFVMKKYNGDYLNGFKAYYKTDNSNVQALRLSFGETTGIDGVVNAGGKLEIYDMSGRRVEKMTKGLYIVNGQKVLVK